MGVSFPVSSNAGGADLEQGFDGGNLPLVRDEQDHMVMLLDDRIVVSDADNVATSFPGFDALARGLGLQISVKNPSDD